MQNRTINTALSMIKTAKPGSRVNNTYMPITRVRFRGEPPSEILEASRITCYLKFYNPRLASWTYVLAVITTTILHKLGPRVMQSPWLLAPLARVSKTRMYVLYPARSNYPAFDLHCIVVL